MKDTIKRTKKRTINETMARMLAQGITVLMLLSMIPAHAALAEETAHHVAQEAPSSQEERIQEERQEQPPVQPDGGHEAAPEQPEEDSASPSEGQGQEPSQPETPEASPSFSLSCALDEAWMAEEDHANQIRVEYSASVEAYRDDWATFPTVRFGVLCIDEAATAQADRETYCDAPESAETIRFTPEECTVSGSYTFPEDFLAELPRERTYEVYAVYRTGEGREIVCAVGAVQYALPSSEPADSGESIDPVEPVESPESPESAKTPARSVVLHNRLEETAWILRAELIGFEGSETQIQWQYDDGEGWRDMEGATDLEYRFEPAVHTGDCTWRVKVMVIG